MTILAFVTTALLGGFLGYIFGQQHVRDKMRGILLDVLALSRAEQQEWLELRFKGSAGLPSKLKDRPKRSVSEIEAP
jgi:hypothetical protein